METAFSLWSEQRSLLWTELKAIENSNQQRDRAIYILWVHKHLKHKKDGIPNTNSETHTH